MTDRAPTMDDRDDPQARREAVLDVVRLRAPLGPAIAALRRFPWDCDRALVVLTAADAVGAADGYLAGALTADELEGWANAVETREDIELDHPAEAVLAEFIFALANPVLTEPITPAAVRRWRTDLGAAGPGDRPPR